MKKRLLSLLLAAVTALSLCASSLAAEKALPFSSMFPGYTAEARDPKAAEAVLERMGTRIGQKQTVKGVTLTLDGAIWNDDKLLLSFAIDGGRIPEDVPGEIYLNRDVMQVTLAEKQREAYVRSEIEERDALLSETREPSAKEELDTRVQEALERREPRLFHLPTLVRSGGKDRLLLSVNLPAYVEQPELTVHMENLALFKNAGGQYYASSFDGCEPVTLVSGPFDFTFTAERRLKPLVYTGKADVTVQGIPVQVQKVTVTAFNAQVECETLRKLDLQNDYTNETKALDPVRLGGVWTRDGLPLKGTLDGRRGGSVFTPDPRLEKAWVTTGNTHPYAIDPASVTAVDLGGVRVDLHQLTLQENPPLQDIVAAPVFSGAEPEKEEEEALTPAQIAQANAEREKRLEEARQIAYQDLKTASREQQARILAARKILINSSSWVADGYEACTVDGSGKKTPIPHFSDLFPGWDFPAE